MSTVSNAVAAQHEAKPTIAGLVQKLRPEIERALPKGLDGDRVARLALTVIRQSEMAKAKGVAKRSLSDCTPQSFAGALLTAAALGLEPGTNGEAYLVPYGTECTLIVGYQGIAKLFWQHPLAKHLDAQAVHERDEFSYELGLHPKLTHKPALGDRGEVIAYYAVAGLTTGAVRFVVLSPDEVKALRGGKVGTKDIADPQRWMERKTVLKQVLKLVPKSTQMAHAMQVDERDGSDLSDSKVPEAIAAGDSPEPEAPEGIDPETGEVLDAETVQAELVEESA